MFPTICGFAQVRLPANTSKRTSTQRSTHTEPCIYLLIRTADRMDLGAGSKPAKGAGRRVAGWIHRACCDVSPRCPVLAGTNSKGGWSPQRNIYYLLAAPTATASSYGFASQRASIFMASFEVGPYTRHTPTGFHISLGCGRRTSELVRLTKLLRSTWLCVSFNAGGLRIWM